MSTQFWFKEVSLSARLTTPSIHFFWTQAVLFLGMSSMSVYSWAWLSETPNGLGPDEVTVASVEQAEAVQPGQRIRGQVLDAQTGELIEKCRVIPTMSEREDDSHITWQSQYLKDFNDGHFTYETDRPWAKTRLRIEADGYLPAITRYVDKGEDIEIQIKLERSVLSGLVKLPDGKPAVGAQIALSSWTNEVRVDDGELSYHGHGSKLRRIVETDEQGQFEIPAEIDPSVLIIAHPLGYAEVANAEKLLAQKNTSMTAKNNSEPLPEPIRIVLEPWGRVEGRVLMDDQPVEGAKYWVYQSRSDDVHVWNQTKVETVKDGRFEVDHVPPGRFGTCQRYVEGSDGTSSYSLSGLVSHFDVPAGKTVSLVFGGRGRTLVGKLMAQAELNAQIDWSKAKLQVRLQPPPFMQRAEGVDQSAQAWSKFQASEEGKWYKPQSYSIQSDGTLRIEGLPAASYVLDVTLDGDQADGTTVWKGSRPLIVPAEKPTDENTTVHLGNILMMLSAGSKASSFSVMTKPSSPQDAKLDPNRPWRAYGRVVDKDGKPLAGVTVRAATGVGTLKGGGSGVTDQEGRYDFQFGKGISIAKNKEGKPNPQTQYAIISASLEGHFEENFNRHGDGIASLEDVDEAALKLWSVRADQVCTPDKPRKLDFVMLPAAKVAGTLIDEKDRPLADYSVALTSKVRSPGSEVLAQVVTDRDGRFSIDSIPTTVPYQFEVRKPRSQLQPPWDDSWASGLISFLEAREGDLAVKANAADADTSVVTVKTFRIKIVGPSIGGNQALKLAEQQEMLSELKRDNLTEKSPTLESWTMTLSNGGQAKKQE